VISGRFDYKVLFYNRLKAGKLDKSDATYGPIYCNSIKSADQNELQRPVPGPFG
jgi:hypothetical protein